MVATVAWRDEMQGVTRSQGSFALTSATQRGSSPAKLRPVRVARPNLVLAFLHGLASIIDTRLRLTHEMAEPCVRLTCIKAGRKFSCYIAILTGVPVFERGADMMIIQDKLQTQPRLAVFNLGFRPFFLMAGLFAPLAILAWVAVYTGSWLPRELPGQPGEWHGHEMLFGYGMAVVSGFLLTAVRNWTRIPTLHGKWLAGLAGCWLAARLAIWLKFSLVWPMVFDLLFDVGFILAVSLPIIRARQRQQIGILAKLMLLTLANLTFWLAMLGQLPQTLAVQWSLWSGLYLLLGLMFEMARRVLPFFIERGVGYPVQLINQTWIDQFSLVLFVFFWLVDVFAGLPGLASVLAMTLFIVHAIRLAGWHTRGIWKKPLLWVLYLGYAIATSGFLLKAATPWLGLSPLLALHAFAVGGIGLMTMGMMARVTLGHTGRDIQNPPRGTALSFGLLALAFVLRVLLPMLDGHDGLLWIALSGYAWAGAFVLFVALYAPALLKPRVDGLPG